MTDILFYSTLVLNFTGLIFGVILLWINLADRLPDLFDRSESAFKIAKLSMITSMAFAFLTCLLSDGVDIDEAISMSSQLYSIIAITWMAVLLICGITMLCTIVSKRFYTPDVSRTIKQLFKIALPGAIISLVLTWVFA